MADTMAHAHGSHDRPSVHGMLMVGDAKIYVSHLPMFHTPHDYQAIFEVTLRDGSAQGGDPAAIYRQDRKTSGERIYTWVPAPFVLPTLFDAPPGTARMQGTIFRGHFERGGTPITSDQVQADVTRVLIARQFKPGEARPAALRYVLFGSPTEAFLAHAIVQAPDFDHVLSVTLPLPPTGWDGSALTLEFPNRDDAHAKRLRENDAVDATVIGNTATNNISTTLRLKVGLEIYVETGDLES